MWYKIFILSFLLLPQLIFCQNIPFRKITVADGLSNNFVRAIHKDQFGFIWFGTLDGLDRYDGVEIRSFSNRFPESHLRVNSIIDEPGSGLWVGTDKGLMFWDFISSKFKSVPVSETLVNVTTLLTLPGDSLLLAGTSKGIYLINTRTFEQSVLNVEADDPFIPSKAVYDGRGKVWISTSTCLVELNLDDFSTEVYYNEPTESAYNNFSSLTILNNNIVLGTMTRGLFLFDVNEKFFSPYVNISTNYILALDSGKNSIIYVGTDGNGFIEIDTKDGSIRSFMHDFSNPGSINSNAIYSILIEKNGRSWLGTYSGGVNYTSAIHNYFQVYEDDKLLGERSIRSLYFDDKGNKFLGSREGLFVLEQSGRNQHFHIGNSEHLRSNVILSFGASGNDVLVGKFRGGLSRYNMEKGDLETSLGGVAFTTGSVYDFTDDQNGHLLIGRLEGLAKIHKATGSIRYYTENNSALIDDLIIAVLYDSKGRLWVGSVRGGTSVYTFEDEQLVVVDTEFDLSGNKAVSFFEDHKGDIWIATEGTGLWVVAANLDKIDHYTLQDGLSNNSVTSVTEAPENIFWISTQRGLSQFDRTTNRFLSYTLSDGLPSLVFNRGAIVNTYETDGKLWFGSERGLISFYPDSLMTKSMPGEVVLTDFYLSGNRVEPAPGSFLNRPVNKTDKITIKAGHGSLGFRFIALNYFNPGDNEYAFRLRGKDEDWQFTTNNYVTFPELKPGNYTFDVYLNQGNLMDISNLASVNLIVKPLFYQTTSFLIFTILIVFCAIWVAVIVYRRLKLLKSVRYKKGNFLRYKSSHLSSSRRNEIESILLNYVENSKPYLNPDLKLSDLAKAIDCPVHDVSQVINQNLNKSYHDFINTFRINAVKECLSDPAFERYTLMAIGQHCGFNSKASFYRAFKKITGKTPNDYQVEMNKTTNV